MLYKSFRFYVFCHDPTLKSPIYHLKSLVKQRNTYTNSSNLWTATILLTTIIYINTLIEIYYNRVKGSSADSGLTKKLLNRIFGYLEEKQSTIRSRTIGVSRVLKPVIPSPFRSRSNAFYVQKIHFLIYYF